jgi:hypothetical protein
MQEVPSATAVMADGSSAATLDNAPAQATIGTPMDNMRVETK